MALPNELYQQCRSTLLECSEFNSDDLLRAVFVTDELHLFQGRLPTAASTSERVDACLSFLADKRLSDGRPVLPIFLTTLRDKYQKGDALRDELETLRAQIEQLPDGPNDEYKSQQEAFYIKAASASLRRSFDALIADKLKGFVGRQFVFDELDEFLGTHNSGYFIIRGVPGIGKSALMAKLVNDRGYVHHFNIASQNIRSTRFFLENVSAQLIVRYNLEYKELPLGATNDGGFLMQCLGEAAAKREDKNERIVLAIDALDEADRLGLAPAVNSLYLPSSLPEGVYVIVTTRPLEDPHLHVARQQTLDLEADSEGNLQDITTYIEIYTQREAMHTRLSEWKVSPERFVAGLRKKSQGNFMYLVYVLPAIEQGKFVKGTLDELPDGLMAYYQRHWRQMREGNEKEFDIVYEPIVCILGVAQEPVTVKQIATWTKLHQGQVKESIGLWREFLEEEQVDGEGHYRIYHASFQDFLKEQVDLVRYDDMIANYYLMLVGLE